MEKLISIFFVTLIHLLAMGLIHAQLAFGSHLLLFDMSDLML